MHLLRILWICLTFRGSIGHNFESVYVTSPLKQLVTSNSLRWEYVKKPHDWVKDTRVVLLNGLAACKGTYKGVSVIGSAKRSNGHCYVELNGSLHPLRTKFYILIQRIKASRLIWSPWNIFTKIPTSSVAYDLKTFVARSEKEEEEKGVYSLGSLDLNAGLSGEISVFSLEGGTRKLSSSTKGDILVEQEPVRYELKNVKYIKRRRKIINSSELILGSKTFINAGLYENGGSWNSIVSLLSYNTSHTYNWGQIWGLIRGLPSRGPPLSPHSKDDFPLHDFEWGIPLTLHKYNLLEVSRSLQAKTGAEATITAKEVSSETPYRAKLISIYEDGSESSIWIEGAYSETVLMDVKVVFDEPYFIKNGSAAPTTTTTTTSTTTSPTTASNHLEEVFKVKNPRHANSNGVGGVADLPPRGERYYSLTSSTTTRNPLYRFYPPDDEVSPILDPKTFSLINSSSSSGWVISVPPPHCLLLTTILLCYCSMAPY